MTDIKTENIQGSPLILKRQAKCIVIIINTV